MHPAQCSAQYALAEETHNTGKMNGVYRQANYRGFKKEPNSYFQPHTIITVKGVKKVNLDHSL